MLKLEFQDCRICSKCGAPAEKIGDHWQTESGERRFTPTPLTYQKRGVFTHCCTRNNYEDEYGRPSQLPKHVYACGALRDIDTARVAPDKMFGRCHVGEDSGSVPEFAAEIDRMKAAANDEQ